MSGPLELDLQVDVRGSAERVLESYLWSSARMHKLPVPSPQVRSTDRSSLAGSFLLC